MKMNIYRGTSGTEALERLSKKFNFKIEYVISREDILKANNFSAPIFDRERKCSFNK
jgi:hypothetical protein